MKKILAGTIALFFISGALAVMLPNMVVSPDEFASGSPANTLLRYDEQRTGRAPLVGDITEPQVRWAYERGPGILTSPIVADIDNDGMNEVVFGGTDGKVTALDHTGNLFWEIQAETITMAGSVGDVDGDGMPEVIVSELWHYKTEGQSLIVLNGEDGSEVWRYTTDGFREEGFGPSPLLEDINGDGIDDLLIASMDYKFYAFDGPTGEIIWTSQFEHYMRSPSPISDMDRDGNDEVVAIDNHGLAKIMDAETGATEWEGYTGYCFGSTLTIGDLDGDGFGEVVVPMCTRGGTVVLNQDGSTLWQRNEGARFYSSPTLVDVDGDGLVDVVNTDVMTSTVLAYRGTDGATLWAMTLPWTTWAQGSPVSLDIDGDGTVEILAGSDSGFYSLNSQNGQLEWFFPTGKVRGQPFVVDLEKEGGAEIVYSSSSIVYVIEQRHSSREVQICLRVEGRKWNTVEATITEDGTPVDSLKIMRVPGSPNNQMQCTVLNVKEGSSYTVLFKYISEGVGANPVKLIVGDGDSSTRMNLVFNSQKGVTQETSESLDSLL
jgi:outer membrane protein assembly factor BamB